MTKTDYMKKYFLFDDEILSGNNYLIRVILGTLAIALFGLGLWVLAASGYKRAGAFGWKRELRVTSAILIPIVGVSNLLSKSDYVNTDLNIFDVVSVIGLIFHLILLFKNGNRQRRTL
jgi:hypothetical protein